MTDSLNERCYNKKRKGSALLVAGLILSLALVLLLPAAVMAGEKEPEKVRVGYYENEVFEEGAAEGSVKTGYAYEYYRKISEYTGWEYEYVYGDFGELYQMLLDGKIDFLAGLAWKEERAGLIGYPDEAMGNETYDLVKHDTDAEITADPKTFSGKTIGVLDSALVDVLEQFLADHEVTANVVTFSDYAGLFDAFDTSKIDILAAEGDGAYGRDHAEVLCAFGASDYYLCVSIHRPELLSELNRAQAELMTEEPNFISTLQTKYYRTSVASRAFTSAEKDWLSEHDTLHVGYLNGYLPYSGSDEQGNATGMVKDLLPHIMENLGIKNMSFSYTGYDSYDEMIADMDAGTIDVAFPVGGGLYYSEENGIYQTDPVISAAMELIFKGDYSDDLTARFAVNENNRMQYYYIRTYYPDAEISFYPSIDDCLQAVESGKESCTTLNGLRANDILKNSRYNDLHMKQLAHGDDRCFGVRIGNEGLLKLMNRGVRVLDEDYAMSLAYRYADDLFSYRISDFIRDHAGAFAGLILAVAAVIIGLLVRDSRRSRKEMRDKEAARLELEKTNAELAKSKEALSEALDAAENANRAKTAFLNNMSHDIRTPMNAIVGFTALAESHIDEKEQVQDYLEKIAVSSRHLLSLINDVLDMSRIESGKMKIEENEVHLPDVIEELLNIIQPGADEKHQDLQIDRQNLQHEDIITDKLRLKQILLNILSNAVKFTPEGGTIRFTVTEKPSDREDSACFIFRIKDNGIGMSEEFQKTIFEAFTRERTSTVSGIQGTGLGMAITRNIVDLIGGTITVDSREGEGTEFAVDLCCRISERSAREESTEQKADFTGKTVLLVEDNEMNQMIAMAILKEAGFTVEIAGDGTEAVERIETAAPDRFDVVLMDIQMPVMDGYEAARQIRSMEDPDKARIPIVAVTANAFEDDRQSAFDAGMNGHLAKPYDIPKMMETLQKILQQ